MFTVRQDVIIDSNNLGFLSEAFVKGQGIYFIDSCYIYVEYNIPMSFFKRKDNRLNLLKVTKKEFTKNKWNNFIKSLVDKFESTDPKEIILAKILKEELK